MPIALLCVSCVTSWVTQLRFVANLNYFAKAAQNQYRIVEFCSLLRSHGAVALGPTATDYEFLNCKS